MKNYIKNFCALFIVFLFLPALITAKEYKVVNSESVSDSTQKECMGELESKKGKSLKVTVTDATNLPEIGMTGTLSKYFEEEILGMNTHGYIDIAEVEVKDAGNNEITFTILKELTNIKINGKKENLFKKGIIVKFSW
jgi:hypothetical protein